MARATDDRYILWPEYFDSNLSKSQGRRTPRTLSVSSPTSEEIFSIARKLGLSPELEKGKAFPSRWMNNSGRIRVARKMNKSRVITVIAEKLKNKKK